MTFVIKSWKRNPPTYGWFGIFLKRSVITSAMPFWRNFWHSRYVLIVKKKTPIFVTYLLFIYKKWHDQSKKDIPRSQDQCNSICHQYFSRWYVLAFWRKMTAYLLRLSCVCETTNKLSSEHRSCVDIVIECNINCQPLTVLLAL